MVQTGLEISLGQFACPTVEWKYTVEIQVEIQWREEHLHHFYIHTLHIYAEHSKHTMNENLKTVQDMSIYLKQ